MAAPAETARFSLSFKDARGFMAHMRFLVGDADGDSLFADAGNLRVDAQAASNAHVSLPTSGVRDQNFGTAAVYQDAEDKAQLTFKDGDGGLHRFDLPAPKAACFLADGETVDVAGAAASLITAIETFVYGRTTDTSPLSFVGGMRLRKKKIRKLNIWVLNPAESGPGE